MPGYERQSFEPPAPLAEVTLRNPETAAEETGVPMLIDSGADISMVPRASLGRIGLDGRLGGSYDLVGFDGTRSEADSVSLELVFEERVFRGQFLVIEQDWGILGRNVLNAVALLLDGPRLAWSIQVRGRQAARTQR